MWGSLSELLLHLLGPKVATPVVVSKERRIQVKSRNYGVLHYQSQVLEDASLWFSLKVKLFKSGLVPEHHQNSTHRRSNVTVSKSARNICNCEKKTAGSTGRLAASQVLIKLIN